MEKWPIGVFASIDAGLGVQLEVAHELGVPTIQLHAGRSPPARRPRRGEFLSTLRDMHIRLTAVFGGFEGRATPTFPPRPAPWAWCRRPPAASGRPR